MVFTCFLFGRARKTFSLVFAKDSSREKNHSVARFTSTDCEKVTNNTGNVTNNGTKVLSKDQDSPPPPDKCYFIFSVFVYLGMSGTINAYYIFSANDYWMWKFRNTSRPWAGAADAENRTDLQASVFSLVLVANAVPALISLTLIVPIIKASRTRPRIYTCFSIFITVYLLYFMLALINSDSWQKELSVLALLLAAVNSGVSVTLLASILTQIAHFSQTIVKAYTIGDGSAVMVTSIVQMLSLLVGGDSQVSGIIYFGIGTIFFLIALVLYINTTNSAYYRYHIHETNETEPESRLKPTLADFKIAITDVWPIIAVFGCCIIGLNMDNISSLIVSEYRDNGTAWAEVYFVPVITMCLGNAFGILGRICSWNLITHKNCYYIIAINVARAVIFLPLYIGCNAYPRTLPVWFPHDWQYIIIMIAFNFSNGFFTTSCVLSIPNFMTGRVQTEIYYLLLQITLSAVSFCTAPLNILVVKYIL